MSFVIQCPACPTQLSVEATMSGQQVRCPNCNTILDVGTLPPASSAAKPRPQNGVARPQPKPAATKTAPGVKTKAPPTARDINLDGEVDAPRPPRAPGSRALWFLIALVVGLGGGAAAGFFGYRAYFKPAEASPSSKARTTAAAVGDLVYLPNNCQALVVINPAKLLASKSYKSLESAGLALEESEIAMVRRLIGAAPDEIERITVGGSFDEAREWTAVVHASKPIRIDEMKTGEIVASQKEGPAGPYTIYERSKFDAFALVDPKTVVLGSPNTLDRVLKRGGPAKLADGLQAVYQPINDTWTLWVGVDFGILKSTPLPLGDVVPQFGSLADGVQAVVVESPADKPLDIQIVVSFKDEASAKFQSKQYNDLLKEGVLSNVTSDSSKPPRFEAAGNLAVVRVAISTEPLIAPLTEMKWQNPDFWVASLADDSRKDKAIALLKENPERSLPSLIRGLDKDLKTQEAVLNLLLDLKEKGAAAAPAVARLVKAPQAPLRLHAVKVLRAFGPGAKRDVRPALLQAETDAEDTVRLEAKRALADLGPLGKADAPELTAVAGNPEKSAQERANALRELAILTPDSPDLVKLLLTAITDKDNDLRAAAAGSLGKAGLKQRDTVYPTLVKALQDAEAPVRNAAVAGLDGFGAPTEKESVLLVALFNQANTPPMVMAAAAKLLGKAGPAAGKDAFAALLGGLNHEDAMVRGACVGALDALPPPDAADAVVLAQKLDDAKANPETKTFVLKALTKLGNKVDRAKVPTLGATLMKLIESDVALADPALQLLESLGPPGEGDVPALLRLMQNPKATAKTRGFAARVLAPRAATSPEVATVLLTGLADADAGIRKLSAEGLAKAGLKTPEAAEAFAKALDDKDAAIRLSVTTALAAMPPEAKAYPHLLRAFEDDDRAVRYKAMEGIKGVQKPEPAAVAAALKSPKLRVRLFMLSILASNNAGGDKEVLEQLVNAARDDSPTVRVMAVEALASSGAAPDLLTPALVGKLKDMAIPVRMAAIKGLIQLKQEANVVMPILLKAAADKTDPAYADAVELLSRIGDYAKPVMPQIMAALAKEETREAAAAALASMGKEAVKDVKDALTAAKDPVSQILLLQILGKIGPDAKSALLEVNKKLQSPIPQVKAAAKMASDAIQKK